MKSKSIARWGLVVAIGLVGCTAGVPAIVEKPSNLSPDAASDHAQEPAAQGNLVLRIQWPARSLSTQAIPTNATTIVITIRSKTGQVLASRNITRPAGEAPVSTVTFQIAPAHGLVDVDVVATNGNEILAQGVSKNVPIRDNTSTGVVITLDSEASITFRIARQIVLLKDLHHYFDRFENWKDPRSFSEVLAMETAVRSVGDSLTMGGQRLFQAMRFSATGMEGAPGAIETWHLPGEPALGLELRDREILKAYWPGYQLAQVFTINPANRRWELALTPGTGAADQTRATLSTELAAAWVPEPQLQGSFSGVKAQSSTPAARVFMLAAGERPVPETISDLRMNAQVDPQGNAAHRFKGALELGDVQDASTSPLYDVLVGANPYTSFWTRYPTKAEASLEFASLKAALTAALQPDFLGGAATLRLVPRDRNGGHSVFVVKADAKLQVEKRGDRSMITGGTLNFALDDELEDMRLEGTLTLDSEPLSLRVAARFVDIPTGTVIGTIDYDAPFDANGSLNPAKNETWPTLVLTDGENGAPKTRIHLTPGLFTGRTSGNLNVYIY